MVEPSPGTIEQIAAVLDQRSHRGAALELLRSQGPYSFGPHFLADQLLRQQHGGNALVAEHGLHRALGRAFDFLGLCSRDKPRPRTI